MRLFNALLKWMESDYILPDSRENQELAWHT
jgi:hypothetical protein